MRMRDLYLCLLACGTALGLSQVCAYEDSLEYNGTRIIVQSTPGDGLVHKSIQPNDESLENHTECVAAPRAWTIRLVGEENLLADENVAPSPTVIWARVGSESANLLYSRFENNSWIDPSSVSTDESGELAERWWYNSLLTFLQGTPGSIDPKNNLSGTPGDINPHLPTARIDTGDDGGPSRVPPHAWTIFVDNSILVIPTSHALRDGEPTFGVTRMNGAIVPTVAWAHANDLRQPRSRDGSVRQRNVNANGVHRQRVVWTIGVRGSRRIRAGRFKRRGAARPPRKAWMKKFCT